MTESYIVFACPTIISIREEVYLAPSPNNERAAPNLDEKLNEFKEKNTN